MKLFNSALVATGLFLSGSALAHVGLSDSMPANGSMVSQAPTTLQLTFTAPVRLVKLTMQDEKQQSIPLTLPSSATSQEAFSFSLPALNAANYTVNWMIMSDDGHKMKGNMSFMLHNAGMNTHSATPMSMDHDTKEHTEHQ
ncbi:copper resistance CopC family protein [Shewanella psychromarinicola]|uniref:Copper resistance protein CopC n=1 Tax=Shewanella psychromarinicola TaxID=2487742 RepID=A0A3N4DQA2_9GAMM|nr:copper resistance CopC family protein [Shewanella psychromarinicola]AZG36289.1 copper resistance protein CopC [Shewanella psychromarinicola]MCL1082205.1 copper resistance protein CopC [Shewanella psychromarinicola]RPA27386.1 copper resistance protein CopC [Shewanella psychromarinicola]